MLEVLAVFLLVLFSLLCISTRVIGLYVFVWRERYVSYVPTKVSFPTPRKEERPKELDEVLKKLEESTEGPPIEREESPIW